MQRKKEATIKKKVAKKKKVIPEKKDTTRKEDTTKKEEDPIKNEDSTPKDELIKKEKPAKKTYLSEKRIKEIVERLRKQVAEFRQLQEEGKKPFYKRIPITVIEIPHVMLIINRSRNVASKFLQEVRRDLGKKPRQKVSVTEFCEQTEIPLNDVRAALNLLT